MAEPFTGYWKPEVGFENIPKFNDKRAELLQWIKKCDAADGYALFRLYQEEGRKYPNHSVLVSCYGGEPIEPESWWLRDVPEYVLDRLEREVDGYNWLISYIVEGVEEKTGNPNGNPNHNVLSVNEIQNNAKKVYGTTNDPREAGYVLNDGSMLDFSGRHYSAGYKNKRPLPGQPDYLKGQRSVDHREIPIEKIFGVPTAMSGVEAMKKFEAEGNAIRFGLTSGEDLNLSFVTTQNITPKQWDRISSILKGTGGTIYYDVYDECINIVASGETKRLVELKQAFKQFEKKANNNPSNPHNNPNHNEDDVWQQRDATQERILDRLKLKESGVKIDEPPILVIVGSAHTVVGTVDGLKLNFALGEIAREDVPLFDTFRIGDRVWHVKKSIALSTLKGRQKARDKREGKQMKMYEEWGGLAKFEKKEEEKDLETEIREYGKWIRKNFQTADYKEVRDKLREWIIEYYKLDKGTDYIFKRSEYEQIEIGINDLAGRFFDTAANGWDLLETFEEWGVQETREEFERRLDLKEEPKPPEPKEPWMMTYREFYDIAGSEYTASERFGVPTKNRVPINPETGYGIKGAGAEERIHRAVLMKALQEGKPVPEAVLKDYPDLAKTRKEEYKPTTIIEKLADDAIHKRGWWRDKL